MNSIREQRMTVEEAQELLRGHAELVAKVRRELRAAAKRLRIAAKTGEVLGTFDDGTPATVERWVAGTFEDLTNCEVSGLAAILEALGKVDHRAELVEELERERRRGEKAAEVRALADRIRAAGAGEDLVALRRRFRELTEDPVPRAARLRDPRPSHLASLGLAAGEFAELRGE